MKWKFLTATLFALLAGTQIVAAQSSPAPDNHANHHATQAPGPAASPPVYLTRATTTEGPAMLLRCRQL